MLDRYKIRDWIYILLRGRETIAEHCQINNYTSKSGFRMQNNLQTIIFQKLLLLKLLLFKLLQNPSDYQNIILFDYSKKHSPIRFINILFLEDQNFLKCCCQTIILFKKRLFQQVLPMFLVLVNLLKTLLELRQMVLRKKINN